MTSTGHWRWSTLQSGQRLHLEVGLECQWHHTGPPESANPVKQLKQGETRWNESETVQKEKESNIPALGVAVGPLPAVEASNQHVRKVARMWHQCHIYQNAHKQQNLSALDMPYEKRTSAEVICIKAKVTELQKRIKEVAKEKLWKLAKMEEDQDITN